MWIAHLEAAVGQQQRVAIWSAPGLLSTTTACPSARDKGSAISRAVKSVVPPGALGTTMVMGLSGNLPWAIAA